MIDPNSAPLAGHAAGRAIELAAVAFAVSKPDAGKTETATFSGASNPQVATDVGDNVAIFSRSCPVSQMEPLNRCYRRPIRMARDGCHRQLQCRSTMTAV